jgi:hypothetical protein
MPNFAFRLQLNSVVRFHINRGNMNNIYEPPASNLDNQKNTTSSLYKTSGVGIATFFGSVLAGGFLMYLNFKRLGLEDKAKKCLLYSIIATIIVFGVIFLIPEDTNIPNAAFTIPQLIAMIQIAKYQQGALIDEHTSSGGAMYSNWKAFGISLVFLVGIMAIIFGLVFVLL